TKYNYDSVFLVSAKSNIYYHYAGINKTISTKNQHDVWYYDFVNSNSSYDLDVDFDEANLNSLTVFVNCRVTDEQGTLLGVVGVGLKMNQLQSMLKSYETDYDLKATIINDEGIVQIDSDEQNIETVNFFSNDSTAKLKSQITQNHDSMEMFWYPDNHSQTCLITQYISTLDWYLVVQKDTHIMREAINSQFKTDAFLVIIVIYLVLSLTTIIINRYNRLLMNKAITDDVTDLPNLKMFHEMYRHNSKKYFAKQGTVFMFDIDNFKKVNDENGHLFGNTVLYNVSMISKDLIGNKGIIARFGGDEFIGVIYGSSKNAYAILESIRKSIPNNPQLPELSDITISIGATKIKPKGKVDTFIKESDTAMYRSKINGRNRIGLLILNNKKAALKVIN
ncbi:MAG: diguanylate cyclase, partial [Oscillospiraceae bacterium]